MLGEQITETTRTGSDRLEPLREFISNLNQANRLRESDDFTKIKVLLKTIGSNHVVRNRRLAITWAGTYHTVAARRAAAPNGLQFTNWLRGPGSNRQPRRYTDPIVTNGRGLSHPATTLQMVAGRALSAGLLLELTC
ncbi:hypothetical protein HY523_00840 [Candidatus Berkelbacteria bacterium]|nr:hypothetical protein [Candidatus Berkelbacteria bacterium]